jgi:hypothetical protein
VLLSLTHLNRISLNCGEASLTTDDTDGTEKKEIKFAFPINAIRAIRGPVSLHYLRLGVSAVQILSTWHYLPLLVNL